ncbi:hypothetical protein H5U35_01930 [Candidatus Aerophobetes bacterium]|nr:hypothetical protein [Candidatus Aerophobetes bacterium]
MTPKERLLTALSHQEPDRVPLDLGGTPTTIEVPAYEELKKYLGVKSKTKTFLRDHVEPDEKILELFEIDTRYLHPKPPKSWKLRIEKDNSYVDEWGIRWKKPSSSLYFDPVGHPLKDATIDDLQRYTWPDPSDEGRVEGLREKAKFLFEKTDYALVADMHGVGIFETSWMLRGFEKFLEDLIINEDFALLLLEKVTEIKIGLYSKFLEAVGRYVQVVMTSDDLGTEKGPLISPQLYRKMIKPFHKKLFDSIKKRTDAYLFFHSCGSVYNFIPDLIEIGVDILNPVQVAAKDMDTEKLKKEFGDKISFWGGIDTQRVLPYGRPDDVEEEVKRRIKDMGKDGGYVLCAVHNIQAGVKPENIVRMYEAAKRYGVYPLGV